MSSLNISQTHTWNDVEAIIRTSNSEISNDLKKLLDNLVRVEDPFKITNQPVKHHSIAAHLLVWAKNPHKLWDYELNSAILMQFRYDGTIGFPGGFIDEDDASIEDGLNRELQEELNLDEKYKITRNDFFTAAQYKDIDLKLYLYVKKVSYDEFLEIEANCLKTRDWGIEVAGILRPILYKMSKNDDRGIEKFIKNKFVGNTLLQLLMFLFQSQILSYEEIIQLIE